MDPDPAVSGAAWFKVFGLIPAIHGVAATVRFLTMSDEEKKRERERPIEQRTNYYDVGGYQIRFALGPEGAMGSFAYNATMDYLLEREKLPGQGMREARLYLNRIVTMEGPIAFLGPLVKSATEAESNWSTFFQRSIVSPWMLALPASEQYRAETPEFYKALGQWFDYSPDKIQHIMRSGVARQADEIIQMIDRMDKGRPLQEAAELPFVGGLFVRDPIGFGSQSVRDVSEIEQRLQLLELRLEAKGWSNTATWPESILTPETQALRTQIGHLRDLQDSARPMHDYSSLAKTFREMGDYEEERNMRRAMVDYAQNVLVGNRERVAEIEGALKLIKEMPMASEERMQEQAIEKMGR